MQDDLPSGHRQLNLQTSKPPPLPSMCSRMCAYLPSPTSWHLRHSRMIRGEKIERWRWERMALRCRCRCWLDARSSCQHGKGSKKFEDGELHVDRGGSSC